MEQQGMQALSFLIGRWKTTGEIKKGEGTQSIKINGTDSYEWILDGSFILHKVNVMMGDDKAEAIELIGEFDANSKTYKMRSFDNQGNFLTMEAHFDRNGTLQILGDKMRSSLAVDNPGSMSARWEKSEDNQTWQPWMVVKLVK